MRVLIGDRLRLIQADQSVLQHILEGNDALSEFLELVVPNGWSEFGERVFRFALEKIETKPEEVDWWTYLPILISKNELIGSCGFKGPPDEQGMVELGYEISKAHRNQGLATELCRLLVEFAFSHPEVKQVQAHTQGDKNASCRVLEKNGFRKDRQILDSADGAIWSWKQDRTP